MTRTRKLILTTTAVAALAALLAGGAAPDTPLGALVPAARAQDKPDLSADWDKAWDRTMAECANKYEQLYKWCHSKKLAFTAINVRRLVLRYDPDNEEVRKFVGYERTPDGLWIRNENRRDQIRQEADVEDPKSQKFPTQLEAKNKQVVTAWKALANRALSNGKAEPANAAQWTEKAGRAWEKVLQVDSGNEEAHKALGHTKVAGRYAWPEMKPFLLAREERKTSGQKRANAPVKTSAGQYSELMSSLNQPGAAAQGEYILVSSVHGKKSAEEGTAWGERALQDFIAIYAPKGDIVERIRGMRLSYLKDRPVFYDALARSGMDPKTLERYKQAGIGGTQIAGEHLAVGDQQTSINDHVVHQVGHRLIHSLRNMAITDLGMPNDDLEDWIQESTAYDLSRRLTGTTHWMCVAFGKYGNDLDPHPDRDIWIDLARKLVEYDDDVELSRLYKCKIADQQLRGPETVKGYAFLQFLFESNAEKAQEWIWHAAAQGTPAACEKVLGQSMDELDRQYRNWILKSW